ncbi:MAG: efflux RND transporter periplasmic adaptor subunit, partial [Synergistaceae bacterium]|nr:efflux RND transporter periplasmic adaptor subunit [Synergistaceae bacterium]
LDPKDVNLNLQAAQAAADKARSDRNFAHTNLERYSNLYEKNAVSKAQLDEVQNQNNATEAALRQAQSNLEEAKRHVEFTDLKADRDGVIVEKKAEAEQVVAAGQIVLTMQQGDEMDVEINVPEHSVVDIRSNPDIGAKAFFPAIGEREFKLSVREVSPQADSVTRTYSVKFSLNNTPEGLASGMTATVDVFWQGGAAPIIIPLSAVYKAQGQPDSVWIFNGNKVSRRAVELGAFGYGGVQVKSGLVVGDKIVVAGVQKLADGQQVKEWTGTGE